MPDSSKLSAAGVSRLLELSRQPRVRRWGQWLGGSFLLLIVLGFFAVPPLLRSLALEQAEKALHRPVTVGEIAFNPLALSLTLGQVSVGDGKGGEQAGFDELYVNLSSASLFKLAAVVDEIRLSGPRIAVTRLEDGRYDISDLLDEWLKPKDEPDSGLPRFSLNNIRILNGSLRFDDRPYDKVHAVDGIELAIPFISSLPYQAEVEVQPRFAANIDGAPFLLDGKSTPFADGRESEINLDLDRFDLGALHRYLPDSLPLRLPAATLDTRLKLVFRQLTGGENALMVVGDLQLSDLKLVESNGNRLVDWKKFSLDLDHADLLKREVVVKQVAIDGIDVNLAVDRNGRMNMLALADKLAGSKKTGEKPAEKAAEPAESAPPLSWTLLSLTVDNGVLHWEDLSNAAPVRGKVDGLTLRVGRIDSKLADPLTIPELSYGVDLGERFTVERMAFREVSVDLAGHRVDIGEVDNRGARAVMLRNAQGQIEWISSPVLKTIHATDKQARDERPWVGQVARLKVADLDFRFEDRSVQPSVVQQVQGLQLDGEKLGNVPNQPGRIDLKARINDKGELAVGGKLQIYPFDAALKIDTRAIPLNGLQGYANRYLNATLQRAQFSNEGEAFARFDKDKLKAGYKGSATLGNLLLLDPENKAEFLKWKSLYFSGIDFRLDPLAVDVREIALSDFFARLILSEAGRLNVADIVRQPAAEKTADGAVAVDVPATGKTAQVEAAAPPVASAPPPIRIAKVTLNNGTVNFSDFFVKPNYSVYIGKLGGRVTGLSSTDGTVADLELLGNYGSAAPVRIAGQLNPLAAKSYLDLQAEVKNVDMTGFSPYSGKYAGYAIEKGKLSLNVAYKLEDRKLSADNKLFIDQFTFGDKVDSPDATSLPVNLAISLLKNNRGEIDLNLPISGSLDDPQFSIGGLIVKVIVNLFVKAVTSPFALLGSMFGDGQELSTVAFAPGRTTLDDAATGKLATLAKALRERSALKLEITGHADPEIDREGVKRVVIERLMQQEKFADLQKAGKDPESAEAVTIGKDEYPAYLKRAYRVAKFPKPRNFVGMQKDLPVDEMEKLLLTNLPATDADLAQLARQRADAVQGWLVEQGKVPAERIFLAADKEGGKEAGGPRVEFSLK